MNLLNYTTKIDADKTANEIAKCLSLHGAKAILTDYDEKERTIKAISFKITLNGKDISFRLPCDWKPVYEILTKDRDFNRYYDEAKKAKLKSDAQLQAVRTAWRIVKDWVEAQMALVETEMVTTTQVFLPYAITNDGHTLSEKIIENPSFLLGDGK